MYMRMYVYIYIYCCAYRLTTESKLSSIMTKYDTEISGRCKMLEKLSEIYKYNKREKYKLQVTF